MQVQQQRDSARALQQQQQRWLAGLRRDGWADDRRVVRRGQMESPRTRPTLARMHAQGSTIKRVTGVNSVRQRVCENGLKRITKGGSAERRRADHSSGSRLDAVLPRVRSTPECVVAMAIVVAQDAVEHAARAHGRRGGSERQQGRRGRQGAPHAKLHTTRTHRQRANKLSTGHIELRCASA